jgi:hypothetical protein
MTWPVGLEAARLPAFARSDTLAPLSGSAPSMGNQHSRSVRANGATSVRGGAAIGSEVGPVIRTYVDVPAISLGERRVRRPSSLISLPLRPYATIGMRASSVRRSPR